MAYATELASGATVLDIADKDLYALRTQANANKLFGVNSAGTGIEVKELKTINNNSIMGEGNITIETRFVGQVLWCAYTASTIPNGYLLCNGAAVSRTGYAALFAVIGTTYGAGDGSTTFNLPDLTDKFIQGSGTAGTVKAAGLPNITGQAEWQSNGGFDDGTGRGSYLGGGTWSGAFSLSTSQNRYGMIGSDGSDTKTNTWVEFNANSSNSIYGNSTTVQPPAITMLPLIKY